MDSLKSSKGLYKNNYNVFIQICFLQKPTHLYFRCDVKAMVVKKLDQTRRIDVPFVANTGLKASQNRYFNRRTIKMCLFMIGFKFLTSKQK